MNNRPELNKKISIQDFKDFYWYKEELMGFCRTENLDKRGGKIEIVKRIEKYLKTGEREPYQEKSTKTSRFDWNTEKLYTETEITDNYKNTENVREFFKTQIGDKFKFNVKFMNWMNTAQGRTLGDAIEQWLLITNEMRKDKTEKLIAPQFEYNAYIRDFLKENPDKTLQEAINYWNVKKSKPGDNKYSQSDIEMTDNKQRIIENLCYTELVYERINKKLTADFSKGQIESFVDDILRKTNEKFYIKTGKNYYVTNTENNIRITINSNTFRIITVDRLNN